MAKKDLIKRADGSYSPRGLWDNIRANKGSGKAPTKEMLAQEKKITREMAKGGSLSHFYPSNIQAYPQGGAMGGPGLPLNVKHGVENGTFLINPYYTNSPTGAIVPQTSIGFGTAPQDPEKGGWSITGRVGREYPALNAMADPYSAEYQKEIPFKTAEDYAGWGEHAQGAADDYNKGAKFYNNVMRPVLPGALENVSYGLNATYKGKVGLGGQRFIPEAGIRADYSQSGGLGIEGTSGMNYQFGKNNYRQGQIRDGYAAGIVGPYISAGINGFTGPSLNYGAKAEIDYRPKFFGSMPGMLYGKGSAQFNAAGGSSHLGFMPQFSGEVGYKMPMEKVKQIDMPHIPMPDMSPLTSFLGRANKDGEENLQMEGGDPNGDFGPRYNASPIDKRWNRDAEDIYVPSTKSGPNAEPIIYDPNDPEGSQSNFKQGGAMNRNYYSMGGRAFADGGQLTQFTEGGTHEQNPLGGIPQGFAPDGKLNLVEQGETKLNAADYVFSDQIKVSKETATLFGLSKGDIGKTFADASKKANRPNSRRENDTIEQVAIQRDLENLMQAQEQQKETEKQEAIAEMQAKYPDLQVVDQAAMQQADAAMQEGMQQPMMDEAAMMQQQQQMAPPAQAPQEIDPAMMAQMQQQGMMSYGGKMYNLGGHMYGGGGAFWRGVGAGAYGVAEGALDTLTFGLTDNITDKGYEALSGLGRPMDSKQAGRVDAARGFGNAAGAVGTAILTGGATTKSAISEGVEGLAQGVSSLPGTNEKVDKVAQGVGQAASLYGSIAGGPPQNMSAIPLGALEGNKAATMLMNAPQNKFITQGMNVANKMFASGGFLGASSGNPFVNQYSPGGPLDEDPVMTFNIGGTPITMTLSQALENNTLLDFFMPETADVDGDGVYDEIDKEQAREAIKQEFLGKGREIQNAVAMEQDAAAAAAAAATIDETSLDMLEGETMEQYNNRLKKMITSQTKKEGLGEMKASPALAAAMALPAAYNIGRGMFGKVDKLDENDYQLRASINPYEMNIDPQLGSTNRAFSTAMQAAKNASPGAGSYLATLGNMASQKQQAIKDLYAQKENFDKAQKLEADKFNAEVKKGNLDKKLAIRQYNAQAKAAKENLLATGLSQAAQAAEALNSTDLQEAYLRTISPDYAGNFQYLSIGEQMAAAARKKSKKQNNETV